MAFGMQPYKTEVVFDGADSIAEFMALAFASKCPPHPWKCMGKSCPGCWASWLEDKHMIRANAEIELSIVFDDGRPVESCCCGTSASSTNGA